MNILCTSTRMLYVCVCFCNMSPVAVFDKNKHKKKKRINTYTYVTFLKKIYLPCAPTAQQGDILVSETFP